MTNLKAICEACPSFRRGEVRAECWCSAIDDHPWEKNCEGARHRRWLSRIASGAPQCQPWTEAGRWYHLPSIPTTVFTCDKAHCVARHPRVRQLLDSRGFRNWSFFWGQSGSPYWAMIRPEYAKLLRDHDPPFLLLEDDVAIRDWNPWIRVPKETEVVYLGGGGSWPSSGMVEEARSRLPGLQIRRVRQIGMADIDEEWVRVFGMFGTHAILYLDKRVMLEMARSIEEGWGVGKLQVDVIFGANQWRWQCMLRRVPFFWQDDGHNNWGTFDYAAGARPAEPPESYYERISSKRARRREVLNAR